MAEKKEWTVMIYLAGDNALAPGVVSQLKAIKQAGWHKQANVIAQFDPQTPGTPTHVFDVNLINKLKSPEMSNVGFKSNDPFIRKLLEDKLWGGQMNRREKLLRQELQEVLAADGISYDPPMPPNGNQANGRGMPGRLRELSPRKSLESFLKFCREQYPAKHYMLLILGHGIAVGNDIFLFDEHVDEHTEAHSLSLVALGEVLTLFSCEVKKQGSEFELVGFHSCSVSSLEVAYELQGTAKYMLASQGPAFVGSWPYRQLLTRLFNDLDKLFNDGKEIDVREMIGKMFFYCLHNSADFLLAGYSYDQTLCNLSKISEIKPAVKELSAALCEGLDSCLIRNLILLAHWRSQSYWEESYTDLYDFCYCLKRLGEEYVCLHNLAEDLKNLCVKITTACQGVINQLTKEPPPAPAGRRGEARPSEKIIAIAEFAGPAYQYSHGLSVFFPWSRPSEDTLIMDEYAKYKVEDTSWREFLDDYFDKTMRRTRREERDEDERRAAAENPCEVYRSACEPDASEPEVTPPPQDMKERSRELMEDVASLVYNEEGPLGSSFALRKPDPADPAGDSDCNCPSIKNYPHDTRPRIQRGKKAGKSKQAVPLSRGFSILENESGS